jgi:hypothetical protein
MKVVPYTTKTGVQIGCRYNESPKPMPIEDEDMLYIQSLFICPREWHRRRSIERAVLIISGFVLVLICIASLMVSK